jgi:hypothetical protein
MDKIWTINYFVKTLFVMYCTELQNPNDQSLFPDSFFLDTSKFIESITNEIESYILASELYNYHRVHPLDICINHQFCFADLIIARYRELQEAQLPF